MDLHKELSITKKKVDLVEKKLKQYSDLHYIFLETESVGKINRYGREYYKINYLKHPNKIVSDFMQTFLYLKDTEENLKELRKHFLKKINKIKSDIKKR